MSNWVTFFQARLSKSPSKLFQCLEGWIFVSCLVRHSRCSLHDSEPLLNCAPLLSLKGFLRYLDSIHHFHRDHDASCLPLKILHNHWFQFPLGIRVVPREIERSAVKMVNHLCSKLWYCEELVEVCYLSWIIIMVKFAFLINFSLTVRQNKRPSTPKFTNGLIIFWIWQFVWLTGQKEWSQTVSALKD